MNILVNDNQFTAMTEKELATVDGGVLPAAVVAVPVGIKVAGYVVGGLSAVGLVAWVTSDKIKHFGEINEFFKRICGCYYISFRNSGFISRRSYWIS